MELGWANAHPILLTTVEFRLPRSSKSQNQRRFSSYKALVQMVLLGNIGLYQNLALDNKVLVLMALSLEKKFLIFSGF